jgi:hypothetical protein
MDESLSDNSKFIMAYAEATKLTCIYTGIAVILILVFMVSPLRTIIKIPFVVNLVILLMLGYIIFRNNVITYNLKQAYNVDFSSSEWSKVKTAIIGGYVFSLFLTFLLITVTRSVFFSQGPSEPTGSTQVNPLY